MTYNIVIVISIKKIKNHVLNLVNFSKFEGIPSWIWLLFFGAWFQLFGLFWMVTGFLIFRPLSVLMKLNTERALLDQNNNNGMTLTLKQFYINNVGSAKIQRVQQKIHVQQNENKFQKVCKSGMCSSSVLTIMSRINRVHSPMHPLS